MTRDPQLDGAAGKTGTGRRKKKFGEKVLLPEFYGTGFFRL
jgi:hypothetical protein